MDYDVIWNGSRTTDPYLCIEPDGAPFVRLVSSLTAEERAEVIACATREGAMRAAATYHLSTVSVGWLVRQARLAGR